MGTPFDDALADLRVSGNLLLHQAYAAPWAVDVPEEAVLRELMRVGPGVRVVAFHLVRHGNFDLRLPGREPINVRSREVILCPGGARHRLQRGAPAQPLSLAQILAGHRPPVADAESVAATELICGAFLLRATPLNPLLSALPATLKVSTEESAAGGLLAPTAEMLALAVQRAGDDGGFAASRLLEIFCAEILRTYRAQAGAATASWFRGLADAKVSKAMALVHGDPAAPWSVETLADAVALSPSRFAARFRDTTGVTTMGYVTRWRMAVACRWLESTSETVDAVAGRVGYGAASSFSRAFKHCLGISPNEWRAMATSNAMSTAK